MVRKVTKPVKINAAVAATVLEVVDAGLVDGMGHPEPGSMCVEAAVCYAMGEPHSDQPKCVLPAIRDTKIELNDDEIWYKAKGHVTKTRAEGLRRLAIAQLGSKGKITTDQWNKAIAAYLQSGPRYKRHLKEAALTKKNTIRDLQRLIKMVKDNKNFDESIQYCPSNLDIDGMNLFHAMEVNTVAKAKKVCEDIVQILIKLKSPGTKYLYLTEGKGKPKAKRAYKKRVIKKHK